MQVNRTCAMSIESEEAERLVSSRLQHVPKSPILSTPGPNVRARACACVCTRVRMCVRVCGYGCDVRAFYLGP